jgi:hypothetical protein
VFLVFNEFEELERYRSGQTGQTVNLLAQPSEVRILPSPPRRSHWFGIEFSNCSAGEPQQSHEACGTFEIRELGFWFLEWCSMEARGRE